MEVPQQTDSQLKRIITPLYNVRGWMKFLGVLSIIQGAFLVLSCWGILVAWLPIWMGILLFSAASGIERAFQYQQESEQEKDLIGSFQKLRTYFIGIGIFSLVPLLIVPVALLAAIAVPGFVKARDNARRNFCYNNMRVIAHAVQQYTIDKDIAPDTEIGLYNDIIMPSRNVPNPELYIPNYLTCPECSATYGDFISNSSLNVTCPAAAPGRNHGTFGDLN